MSVKQLIIILFFAGGFFILGTRKVSQAFTYPIPELGNCRDQNECHLYCEIPKNKAYCWSYNIYSPNTVLGEESPEVKMSALDITFPIGELGNCRDLKSCKTFCDLPAYKTVCKIYAQKHGLVDKEKLIERARTELGCTTLSECRDYCNQDNHQDACREFNKKYHLRNVGKERLIKQAEQQLGCSSSAQCREFCLQTDNRSQCEQFLRQIGSSVKRIVKKISDCKTPLECRKYCVEHPNKCPLFPKFHGLSSPSGSPVK